MRYLISLLNAWPLICLLTPSAVAAEETATLLKKSRLFMIRYPKDCWLPPRNRAPSVAETQ